MSDIIAYRLRFFVPDNERAVPILSELFAEHPIIRAIAAAA